MQVSSHPADAFKKNIPWTELQYIYYRDNTAGAILG